MNKKVSILIPVYNVPSQYLARCINSALNQTYDNIEVIIVNDGSTTSCIDDCMYLLNNEKIIYFTQMNKGLSAARNMAYSLASGDYIMFLDGDYYLDLNACKVALSYMENENLDVLLFDTINSNNNSFSNDYSFDEEFLDFYTPEKNLFLQKRVLDFNGKIAQVFARMIRKKLLDDYKIKHVENCKQGAEGLVFNIILFNYTKRVKYIHKTLYYYQYNDLSISHKLSNNNIDLTLLCFVEIKKLLNEYNRYEDFKEIYYNRLCYVVVTSLISGIFNPDNKVKYRDRIEKSKELKKNLLVIDTLKSKQYKKIGFSRFVIINLFKCNMYLLISLLAKIRNKEYKKR